MRGSQRGEARRHRSATAGGRIGVVLALGAVTASLGVVTAGLVVTFPSAGASTTAAGSPAVSPTSGPVGTEVHLSGDMGPCPQLPTTGGQPTAFVELVRGDGGRGQPNEWINVPIAADGTWHATVVIPSFVGGQAMTQGSQGGAVTPGTWTFDTPTCNSAPVAVGFTVTGSAPPPSSFAAIAGTPDGKGYWLAQSGGGVYAFGDAGYYGSLPGDGVTPFGAIVGITPTPDGRGYWLVGADGGVFTFGDAAFVGSGADISSIGAGVPRVGLLATSDGQGYLLPAATGLPPAVYGDATTIGRNATPIPLAALVTGAAMAPGATGYWEASADGGVYAFGSAPFDGSLPGLGVAPAAPIMAMAAAAGGGYWLLGADGGVFSFGGAGFYGSAA